jgi:hypothetical protein
MKPVPSCTVEASTRGRPSSSRPMKGPGDVDDAVHRPHLVEVHLIDGLAVHLRLGTGDLREHGDRVLLHPIGQVAAGDDRRAVGQAAGMRVVMMVCVVMRGVRGGRVVQHHVHILHLDGRHRPARVAHLVARDVQPGQLGREPLRVDAEIDQDAQQHVAADP